MQDYILPIYLETRKSYRTIKLTHDLLNSTTSLKIPVHSAGQWLLDNMYIIEQEYVIALEGLRNIKEQSLPYVKPNDGSKQLRVLFMADEIVEKNSGIITDGIVSNYVKEFQKHSYITFAELSLLPLMLRCALIKYIKRVSLNIFNSEIQKLKVEKRVNKSISHNAKSITSRMDKLASKLKIDLNQSSGIKTSNTAYIEYMAFKLKDMGRQGETFFNELKEETNKIGFTLDEAIEKEHNEITTTTRLIGNGIISLKTVASTNWSEVVVAINKIDQTLKQDYTGEYTKCDYKTKNRYRRNIVKLARKYKLSEMYVAKKAVECSEEYKKHVGHFLIGKDKKHLIRSMGKSAAGLVIKEKIINPLKPVVFILLLNIIAFILAYVIDFYFINHYALRYRITIGIISFVLGLEIADKIISYLVGKFVRPKILPRFNFAKTIDESCSTIIAMPSVINSIEKLDKMVEKMEVTYLANRSENMYYMLLGDCIASKKTKHIALDDEIVRYGKEKIEELNKKYPSEHKLFNFLYRKRVYSECEETYMGWERKRGALGHLNKLLLGKLSEKEIEKYMYLAHNDIPKVKYLITVDEDTSLSLNSAKELVAIISHPLNKPQLSKDGRRVVSGYGLIQPAVGLDIESANRSIFSKVFGGFGGLDIYTNAISNLYQDVFKEAIFTGKGIYDIELFEQLLGDTMPENLILSHDLLEGSYMRTGLASDVEVQDGFPHNFIAYMKRNHRWYRGDMQIISWLASPKSPLNLLSRWKILDNLRRESLNVFALLLLIITMFIPGTSFVYSCIFVFVVINFGHILSTIDNIIWGKNAERKQKQYIPVIYGIRANLLKMVFNFITLPYAAWTTISAHITSLYRMFISKKHLLEWATAEAIEKGAKEKLSYVYRNMWSNVVFGIALVLYSLLNDFIFVKEKSTLIFGIFFLIAPLAGYIMSKRNLFKPEKELTEKEDNDVKEIARDTWKFFETTMIPINNYLAPDNIQENRRPKVVNRTSSTNIGFSLLSIINAYDLGFIDIYEAIFKLSNSLKTVEKLEKWNGHLLNWYNIRTLEPLKPLFVSTVDSGNFVVSIYVVREFLEESLKKELENNMKKELENMIATCTSLIENADFTVLYDKSKNIFSIGFDLDKNEKVKSYYDILMSESRLTSLVAIASRQVTSKHWFSLARNLVKVDLYKGLLSWSGTSFEYFMPNLFTKSYEHTLIDEALFFSVYSQIKYGKKASLPWGISESAFAMQDSMLNYQYKAFGVPWLGLKRGLNDSMVVSPYSSIMCMSYAPRKVYNNLKELRKYDAYSTYGFYESIDFTKTHIHQGKKYETVKTYMAHHQGMILTSLNNYLNKNIIQERFHKNPDIKAAEILLKERVPMGIPIKENINSKYNKFTEPSIDEYTSHITYITKGMLESNNHRNINVQTNGKMSILTLDTGENFMYYNNYAITKNRYTDKKNVNGNTVFFTDKSTGKVWSGAYEPNYSRPDNYGVLFNMASSDFYRQDGDIETFCRIHVAPEYNVEIRKYTLINHSNERKEIVINTSIDLAMCEQAANVVHPAFNNLKIEEFYDEDLEMIIAKRRTKSDKSDELFVFAKLIGIDLGIEAETEKMKLTQADGKYAYSGSIANYPLIPVISYRARILLDPKERQSFYYVVGAADTKYAANHAIVNLDQEGIEDSYNFAIQKENVSARYLKLKQGMAKAYNKIIYDVLFSLPKQGNHINEYWDKNLSQSMLWKFSISGDLPIIQVPIGKIEDTSLLNEIVNFMDYVKYRKIDLDIVLVVDEDLSTGEPIKNHINKYLQSVAYMSYTRGNIYVVNIQNMTEDEIALFNFLSKKTIHGIDELKADLSEEEIDETNEVDDYE